MRERITVDAGYRDERMVATSRRPTVLARRKKTFPLASRTPDRIVIGITPRTGSEPPRLNITINKRGTEMARAIARGKKVEPSPPA